MKHSLLTGVLALLSKSTIAGSGHGGLRRGLTWAARSSWLLLNPRISLEIAQVLGSAQTRSILRADPRVMFKYLYGYLATDLSRAERASMLIHHYSFLKRRTASDFFDRIIDGRLELWQHAVDGREYRMRLSFPHNVDGEGDLGLFFEADGVDIYTLSFTIGPGGIAGLAVPDAIYIARTQGKGKGIDRIRTATRDCGDVSPARILLAAAEGIAHELGIEHMVGIGASTQISMSHGNPDELIKAYDEFWKAAGGAKMERDMYHLALPVLGKPILEVKRGHRSRTLRKRRFKKLVKEQVGKAFSAGALRQRH
jgi:uncharacterized protein VirK/YbjX